MKKTYHIIIIGCQMNKSDSERIASYLDDLGYSETSNQKKADLVIITTCGVRQSAEDRVYGLVPKIKRENPDVKVIITGCLSEREDVVKRLQDRVDIFLPIAKLTSLARTLGEERKIKSYKDYLGIRPKYDSSFSAFVPVGNGCNNFCTYCVVPYARGREVYRDPEEIHEEVKGLIEKGYKEIILIAQNVNSYICANPGASGSLRFPELLKKINDINGNFWLRFATSHPKDMSDELIKSVFECEKVCHHIHLPAQAGDDKVLRKMNRKYTKKHYLSLIEKIRIKDQATKKSRHMSRHISRHMSRLFSSQNKAENETSVWNPPVSITTDIIVGFPGESKKQFLETADLFEQVKYDMAYIAQYSPRPGTAAEKMEDDVDRNEKKRREEELMKILRRTSLENNKAYLDKTVLVLVEAVNKEGLLVGKTETSKVVKIQVTNNVEQITNLIGQFVLAKITNAEDFGLHASLLPTTY